MRVCPHDMLSILFLPFSFIKASIFILFYSIFVGLRTPHEKSLNRLTLDILVSYDRVKLLWSHSIVKFK